MRVNERSVRRRNSGHCDQVQKSITMTNVLERREISKYVSISVLFSLHWWCAKSHDRIKRSISVKRISVCHDL